MTQEVLNNLIVEFQEIGNKTNKLRDFILNENEFNKLDNLNKDLIIAQLKAMEAYISTLSIRIGLNSKIADSQNTDDEVSVESESNE